MCIHIKDDFHPQGCELSMRIQASDDQFRNIERAICVHVPDFTYCCFSYALDQSPNRHWFTRDILPSKISSIFLNLTLLKRSAALHVVTYVHSLLYIGVCLAVFEFLTTSEFRFGLVVVIAAFSALCIIPPSAVLPVFAGHLHKRLNSLKETPLPVSRKKMASITRAALKAIKFYKHVVQSVEKFIIRCPSELKIPGLYVIDAVVRQSQSFYQDKDVYGPRFMRNLVAVFLSLLQCEEKDKPMISRVLYLWQRSSVFPLPIIQALQNVLNDPENQAVVQNGRYVADLVLLTELNIEITGRVAENMKDADPDGRICAGVSNAQTQLLQLQVMQRKIAEQSALLNHSGMIDPEVRSQLRTLMSQLNQRREEAEAQLAQGKGEEELSVIDPSFLARLQAMVDTLAQTRALQERLNQGRIDTQQHQSLVSGHSGSFVGQAEECGDVESGPDAVE
ncbi:protein SCAF8, partial [Clonorchis sinensis]